MFARLLVTLLSAALLLAAADSHALCLPIVHQVTIGSSTSGTGCNYVYADIQTAINNACPNTVISITGGVTLANVALDINGKSNLTLVGLAAGTTCIDPPPACDPTIGCGSGGGPPPPPNVTLQGTGAASVIYIHGSSSVTLQSLKLTGGGGTDFGGGIHFTGSGSLEVVNSTIVSNTANSQGGGIQFNSSGGDATLTLDAGTIIEQNTSGGDGGGVHVNGYARMFALKPYTWIYSNKALNGSGGGVYVDGPARADIGSPGYNGVPVIDFNEAANGGGIAVHGGTATSFAGTARLLTVDENNPIQVSNNSASVKGGAIYARGTNSGGNLNAGVVCAFDSRIENNIAPEGAAIYLDYENDGFDLGSVLRLNGSDACGPESPPTLGAVPCARGVPCNDISGNAAEDSLGSPTAGSVIFVGSASAQSIDRLVMRNNAASSLLKLVGAGGDISGPELQNCLFVENHTQQELISVRRADGQYFDVGGCTFANNILDSGYALHADANTTLVLTDSIFAMPGVPTLEYGGSTATISYILSNDTATLPVAPGVIQGDPTFVNAAGHDYHLQATSIGIDYAPATGGSDLDRVPRDVDLAPVPNNYGPRDIGAYERQFVCAADEVFCDGFETYQ